MVYEKFRPLQLMIIFRSRTGLYQMVHVSNSQTRTNLHYYLAKYKHRMWTVPYAVIRKYYDSNDAEINQYMRHKILNNHSLLAILRVYEQIKLTTDLQEADTEQCFTIENPKNNAIYFICNYALPAQDVSAACQTVNRGQPGFPGCCCMYLEWLAGRCVICWVVVHIPPATENHHFSKSFPVYFLDF